MLQPERALLQVVEQLEDSVREKEAALADFERRAKEHIESLKEDIARHRRRIELFRNEMTAMKAEARPAKSSDFTISAKQSSVVSLQTQGDPESRSARIRAAAKVILQEAGRPMMQKEIEAEIRKKGIEIPSTRLIELIRAALRRDPAFENIKNEGWVLKDADAGR